MNTAQNETCKFFQPIKYAVRNDHNHRDSKGPVILHRGAPRGIACSIHTKKRRRARVRLTGVSPFHGDNDTETLQNVVNVKYSLDDVKFNKVSPDAKNFIAKLLVFDQSKRLSATTALSHPWMQISHDKHDKAQLLTTHFLKEFNYRHKWVERRVFIQYSPDDEQDLYYSARYASDLEPIYIPLLTTTRVSTVDPYVTATVPLKLPSQYTQSS
uniref:Protein kinase domain-containing protein n=1 Tax=Romanomermis culicivorax TaxID=13658 RepID=A0A915JDT1_ROMCU